MKEKLVVSVKFPHLTPPSNTHYRKLSFCVAITHVPILDINILKVDEKSVCSIVLFRKYFSKCIRKAIGIFYNV